ncbi:hypothetical protein G4B88_023204 [Cannabis sativa]|uniref:Disease resistance N-terminal domain-containing protein n=1 Tax=Cannabis sativa TaxID=3483 RepID=A0A7J6EHE7_CANSA|nr:hypothetical protein G4B88_023204 [Cannabis sativa]
MAELVIGAFLTASFDLLLQKIASPYVKDFFKGENESSVKERLFKLKSTFNSLAAVRFEVENKRIKNPGVEDWLHNLLDAVDEAEDFFGDIEYDAMKPNKADESKKEKQKAISKFLSCFSKPSTSTDRVRNANMVEILERLEYLANQIGNLNLEKNVVEVQPPGISRVKTSLPDEPELYVSMSFFVKSKDGRGRSIFLMHDLLVDLANIVSGKYSSLLEHNEDIVKFEKKTRHLGCDIKIYADNIISITTRNEKVADIIRTVDDWIGRSCFVMHDLLVDLAKIVSGKYSSLLGHNDDIVKFEKKTRRLGLSMSFFTKIKTTKTVDLARTISGKYNCLLEENDDIDRLEKKTRHLGCDMEIYIDNKISNYDFEATRLRTFLTFDSKASIVVLRIIV